MPKMWVRCVLGTFMILAVTCTYVYFTWFDKPPTEDILAANRKSRSLPGRDIKGLREEDFYIYYDGEAPDPIKLSQAKWDLWIKINDYVDVGDVYLNSCGEYENPIQLVLLYTNVRINFNERDPVYS